MFLSAGLWFNVCCTIFHRAPSEDLGVWKELLLWRGQRTVALKQSRVACWWLGGRLCPCCVIVTESTSSTIHVSDMFFRLVFHFRMFHVNNLHGPKMAIENQVYFGTIWTSRSCAPPSLKWSLISFCWCKQMMEATHALLQPISCGSSASCGCCAWCEWSRWLCVGGGDFGEGWTCYETT